MCSNKNELSLADKEQIFGGKEITEANAEGLELRYQVEVGQEGEANYCRQRVYRALDGKYYLAIKGGPDATTMLSPEIQYYPDGREVLIPVRPEALVTWAERNLYGNEYERAMEEFGQAPETYHYETLWTYQQGDMYEFLQRTTGDRYMLFSTDAGYPCPGYNTPYIELNEDGTGKSRDDLYIYYVVQETARRWAEARGMDEAACKEVFGRCA